MGDENKRQTAKGRMGGWGDGGWGMKTKGKRQKAEEKAWEMRRRFSALRSRFPVLSPFSVQNFDGSKTLKI
jgi:hypothetical protein